MKGRKRYSRLDKFKIIVSIMIAVTICITGIVSVVKRIIQLTNGV